MLLGPGETNTSVVVPVIVPVPDRAASAPGVVVPGAPTNAAIVFICGHLSTFAMLCTMFVVHPLPHLTMQITEPKAVGWIATYWHRPAQIWSLLCFSVREVSVNVGSMRRQRIILLAPRPVSDRTFLIVA